MCDSLRAAPGTPRPRWWALVPLPLVAAAALLLVERAALGPVLKVVLASGVVGITFAGMACWARANRAALDLARWCACASSTVRVREFRSRPARVAEPRPGKEVAKALYS